MITDFRREKSPVAPLLINGSPIEIVVSFKFLATTISSGLDWEANIISILKKARKRMYFLRKLKKFGLRRKILLQFYRAVIESALCFSLSVWFGSTTKDQQKHLSRVVKNAERIIGCELPSPEEMYLKRSVVSSKRIIADQSHPAHGLFQLLSSGWSYRAMRARTNRLSSSFFVQAVGALTRNLAV